MSAGLLAKASSLRRNSAVAACEGVPTALLTPGSMLKLSRYLHQLQSEVEFLRDVREIQAARIRQLGGDVTRGDGSQ